MHELIADASRCRLHKRPLQMQRALHLDLFTVAHHRYDYIIPCHCVLNDRAGYALAIRATNGYERYAAVFLMAAGM